VIVRSGRNEHGPDQRSVADALARCAPREGRKGSSEKARFPRAYRVARTIDAGLAAVRKQVSPIGARAASGSGC